MSSNLIPIPSFPIFNIKKIHTVHILYLGLQHVIEFSSHIKRKSACSRGEY